MILTILISCSLVVSIIAAIACIGNHMETCFISLFILVAGCGILGFGAIGNTVPSSKKIDLLTEYKHIEFQEKHYIITEEKPHLITDFAVIRDAKGNKKLYTRSLLNLYGATLSKEIVSFKGTTKERQ